MSVSIEALTAGIKAAFDNEKNQTDNQQASIDRLAKNIAKAVADQIVQGINTATVVPALTSPVGAVTGSITITASAK